MSIMFFISQQLALFVLRIIIENTKRKCDFNISNLTNSGLLTIEKHYTLIGSSAFLHFELSSAQDIGTTNIVMHQKSKKPLIFKGFRSFFNDKKKTVGRCDCINLLLLLCERAMKRIQNPNGFILQNGFTFYRK